MTVSMLSRQAELCGQRGAHIVDQPQLWKVVSIPAPVEGAIDVLVWVVGPVHWVQVVGKLSKVMQPQVSLHGNLCQADI